MDYLFVAGFHTHTHHYLYTLGKSFSLTYKEFWKKHLIIKSYILGISAQAKTIIHTKVIFNAG